MIRITCLSGGSAKYGLGHVKRTNTLYNGLKNFFRCAQYVLFEREEELKIDIAGTNGVLLSDIETIDFECGECVIVDLPEEMYTDIFLKWFKKLPISVLTVGLDVPFYLLKDFDMVISLWDRRKPFIFDGLSHIYIGLSSAIIRDDLCVYRKSADDIHGQVSRVVVSIGSADIKQVTPQIISLVSDCTSFQFDVIKGPLAQWDIKDFENHKLHHITFHSSPSSFAILLASADCILCNGGSTLMESCFIGTPAIVLPQTSAEMHFSTIFEKAGACILASNPYQAKELLVNLAADPKRVKAMAIAGLHLIDGKGIERIRKAIIKNVDRKQKDFKNACPSK